MSKYKDMRIIVMFDMPNETKKEQKEYRTFRNFLLKNGYIMIQYSVYSRFCRNTTDVIKHTHRVIKNTPKYGNIRLLTITDKQYNDMTFIIGEFNLHEKTISKNPLIIIE